MCRLYGFHANEPTKVECSLILAQNALLLQSRSDQLGRSHPHGWGIAFYRNSLPEVQRSAAAAFEDLHFSSTVERIYTRTVVAHVRQATVGLPALVNSHPFAHGSWVFAHNGTVTAFQQLQARIQAETDPRFRQACQGKTDSEHVFYWLLTRMEHAGISSAQPCANLALLTSILAEAVSTLDGWCREAGAEKPARLNFLLTDGIILVASRWNNTLYWVERQGVHDCEICGIPHIHHDSRTQYRAVVLASEPITHESWQEVPNGSIVAVDRTIRANLSHEVVKK